MLRFENQTRNIYCKKSLEIKLFIPANDIRTKSNQKQIIFFRPDATVTCKWLGYSYGYAKLQSYYGNQFTLFVMDNVLCIGKLLP